MTKLDNKVAMITGAGSGIGRASAYLFAREGANLIIADINDAGGEETVANIRSDSGEAIFIHTDVTMAYEVERLVKTAMGRFGKIDILYNNAGIFMGETAVEDIEESFWDRLYAVNVKSVFLMVKYVVPEMKRAGKGVIINTASSTAVRYRGHISAYTSTKGAVITLTKALAVELGPYKIRVNCIIPGATDTPMIRMLPDEIMQKVLSMASFNRLIKPEEIAHAALYLASDEATMITGADIKVDGGRGI